jgi:hypothetical protein
VEPADARQGDDRCREGGPALDGTAVRRVLADAEVRPVLLVVADRLLEQGAQVAFAEDDDVVEQLAPNRSNEALHDTVLPGTPEAGAHRLNAHRAQGGAHLLGKGGVAVMDEVAGCRLERERLPELLGDPGRGRVAGDGAADDLPTAVADDDKDNEERKVAVGTVKRSMAARPARWLRRKVDQVWCPGLVGRGRRRRKRDTVRSETAKPRRSNSP